MNLQSPSRSRACVSGTTRKTGPVSETLGYRFVMLSMLHYIVTIHVVYASVEGFSLAKTQVRPGPCGVKQVAWDQHLICQ